MGDATTTKPTSMTNWRGVWTDHEHERFLEALDYYPKGPWRSIAVFVGTRTTRQVQSHAQKYYDKLRDLRQRNGRSVKLAPRIDSEMHEICEALRRRCVAMPPQSAEQQQQSENLIAEASWILFGEEEDRQVTVQEREDLLAREGSRDPGFDECLDFLIETLTTHDDTTA